MDRIISLNQTVLVLGQWISENTLILIKIIHIMCAKARKDTLDEIKVNMHKAYDSVE